MRALRVDVGHELTLKDHVPAPEPISGEALIRVHKCALVHDDALAAAAGEFVGTLGHLFIGTVKKLGPGSDRDGSEALGKSMLGKRVVASPSIPCSHCEMCRSGLATHCRSRQVLGLSGKDGACAEYLRIPFISVIPVPDNVSDEKAVLAFPLARAFHAANMLHAQNKAYITVLGDNFQALLTVQVLSRLNKSARLLPTKPDRGLMCERWGVRQRPIHEAGRRHDQDAVIDCTGTLEGLWTALRMVRPRGTVVLMSPGAIFPFQPGAAAPSLSCPIEAEHHQFGSILALASSHEVQMLGCREGPIAQALGLLAENAVDVSIFASSRCRIEHAAAALASLRDPDHLPVIVDLG